MIINHNMASLNTYRQMSVNEKNTSNSLEKLSSGLRINRAGDDAAGLAISEKMRGQIRGLDQASRNAQDGISMIQTAEGALNETHSILQRMRELSVQASSSTLQTEDRDAIGDELVALKTEVNRISTDTEFNGLKLLNGDLAPKYDGAASTLKLSGAVGASVVSDIDMSGAKGSATSYTFSSSAAGKITLAETGGTGKTQTIDINAIAALGNETLSFDQLGISVKLNSTAGETAANLITGLAAKTLVTTAASNSATFHIGANAGQNMTVGFTDMSAGATGLNLTISDNQAVSDITKAQALITNVSDAIKTVSTQRGKLGAAQNRLEHTIANLGTSSENMTAAESRIRDVDMAKEMMNFQKNNILQQAAQAMLAQANQQPQGVLQLLR